MPDSVEFDPSPGFNGQTHQYGQDIAQGVQPQDQFQAPVVPELLASTVAYSQRGVTLAGGQGVLPTGCVIAQQTSTGLYFKHDGSQTDGRQVAIGILRDARDTGGTGTKPAANCLGNMVYRGTLNAALISGTDASSLVTGFGGGVGSGANGAYTSLLSKGRLMGGNAVPSGAPFPGSPMDSSGGNLFIF